MTDAEFLDIYQATLEKLEGVVEDAITEQDTEIDYESGNDMLTLSFRGGSVAIISRQSAVHQLWLAAKSGGFHFDWNVGREQWVCTLDGRALPNMLSEICQEQGGVDLRFD